MRLTLVATFVALVGIPIIQIGADLRADKLHLYIWSGYFPAAQHTVVSKHPSSRDLDRLFSPKLQKRDKTG